MTDHNLELKKAGLKVTLPRIKILEILQSPDNEASKALVDDSNFVGLGIDEDRQPELTEKRVKDWCAQVYDEMCLAELAD